MNALANENCWEDAYGRGVGKPIHTCRPGQEQNGGLCYPLCKDGYYGVGPVCWQNCPSGFTDTGVDCLKPPSYGRGAGYTSHEECYKDNKKTDCEKWGDLWYPKCKDSFHNVDCCVCSPDCVNGQIDIGVSCQKLTYGRGVGEPLGCSIDEEEQAALCYTPCKQGYNGDGPVCWQYCPQGMHTCGALCTVNADGCTDEVKDVVSNVVGSNKHP
ncbi:UNKNOWN [Stylonychia lemnae]|uniref:Uncharacterized protein n=1 Tax=Stylonychia lemnae TaxID=5949 RepID=A0A078A137_STYLE|nr:UNKNOWN [Stylonychia lemnae]|eukprot:CDW75562.1 UNKNOWN [Stylonychia lemnae]